MATSRPTAPIILSDDFGPENATTIGATIRHLGGAGKERRIIAIGSPTGKKFPDRIRSRWHDGFDSPSTEGEARLRIAVLSGGNRLRGR
jgi:hypothetical protein